jgi:hypothetical protein
LTGGKTPKAMPSFGSLLELLVMKYHQMHYENSTLNYLSYFEKYWARWGHCTIYIYTYLTVKGLKFSG